MSCTAFVQAVLATVPENDADPFAAAKAAIIWRGVRLPGSNDWLEEKEEEAGAVGGDVLTLRDCSVGSWVEVESGKTIKWFGRVEAVQPGPPPTLTVRWLGATNTSALPPAQAAALRNTWTWRGGAHIIELATVLQVSRRLFSEHRTEALGLVRDVFCTCASCAALTVDEAAVPSSLLRWERDVASELCSRDLSTAPFVYTMQRLFKLTDSTDVVIEERLPGRCCCKGRAYAVHCARGSCASQAINRGGVARKLVVRQCGDKRGIGIFAGENIPKHALVCEYVGEVIRRDEARRREKRYSELGLYYLHDVMGSKAAGGEDCFTIDPTQYGNVARCTNHSCVPNLSTHELPVSRKAQSDLPRVPRVGFFAARDIVAGEQLYIDYSSGGQGDALKKVIPCLCGNQECKGFLF